MKHRNLITMLLSALMSALLFAAPTASAQQDIGDIIDEIFKGGKLPDPDFPNKDYPLPEQGQQGRIDNIPVEIRFNTGADGLPAESMLIVTAYAPPPPNVRRSSPLMLGQTRLLLSDMPAPLKIIVAAPSSLTQELDYARIEAKITDVNGAVIYELKQPGTYNGYEAAVLNLTRIGEFTAQTSPEPSGLSSETVRGSVKLNGRAPKFSGSNLIVRLIEDGLAGGNSSNISGESRQILDGKSAPFAFEFERVMDKSSSKVPLALEVWIEDWAGRKTHVTPAPIPYNGPDTKYRIRLDAIGPLPYNPLPRNIPAPTPKPKPTTKPKTKPKPQPVARPKPIVKPLPAPIPLTQTINGEARFNAVKGLPKGSMLIVELERLNNGARPALLASTRVFLDGLSGDVSFRLKVNSADIASALSTPRLRLRLEDKNGKLFFSNPGGTALQQGFNVVKLTTSPNY